jgi:diadenosine tetraphosphate (Ap4A) HIT family hydrolase
MAHGLLCDPFVRLPILVALTLLSTASFAHADNSGKPSRLERLRGNARFFTKITVDKNWKGERVVHHDSHTTAFLDMTDPEHPRFDAQRVDEDETIAAIPMAKRAHVLVIPNIPREHIAKSITGTITLDDIEATRLVLTSAHQLAKKLGIQRPRIYLNTSDRLTVGYLHVHIVGERDGTPYPTLQP